MSDPSSIATAEEHYETLLAEFYLWMAGGFAAQADRFRQFFADLGIRPQGNRRALDLGCGPGFQSIPLAEHGFEVVGVDSSQALLDELRRHDPDLRVTTVNGDLRDAATYTEYAPFEVAVCMGDSLLHLSSVDEVAECVRNVRSRMVEAGAFVVSFRDLTNALSGPDRCVPVRLERDRLMTTFLEYEANHVIVNDCLMQWDGNVWQIRKSSYRKLRLAPTIFIELLRASGFGDIRHNVQHNFWTFVAKV